MTSTDYSDSQRGNNVELSPSRKSVTPSRRSASPLHSHSLSQLQEELNGEAPVIQSEAKSKPEPKRSWYDPINVFGLLLDNWFLIGIGVFVVLAWRFPHVGKDGGSIKSQYSVQYGAIGLIFLITGLTLSTSALYRQFKNWYLHIFTQVFSLLFFPSIVFAIISIIRASHNAQIDPYILVGMMVMGCMPTTVASNVSMTRIAKGNTEAATMEVCIGQVLGIFFSPLLLDMYFSSSGWKYGQPAASGGKSSSDGLKEIYRQVGKHMGLALFLPMFIGQVIQYYFPKHTKWTATTFRLPKVSQFCLLLLLWTVFCNQFAEDAFSIVSGGSIAMVVILNLVLYLMFTYLCLILARLPFLPKSLTSQMTEMSKPPLLTRTLVGMRFNKKETTAICFCAAAKGLAVGAPILSILYGGFPVREKAIISIPLVLYQGEQVAVAQVLTYLFRRWNERPDKYEETGKARSAEGSHTTRQDDLEMREGNQVSSSVNA